jgi:deoxyribodipyrimidine photo-lyase
LIHEPWKLNAIEQQFYHCEIGKDYPFPIVDIDETRKKASDIVWSYRKNDDVKEEGKRILKKHVNRKLDLQSKNVLIIHSELDTKSNPNKTKNARSKKAKPSK